MCAPDWCNGEDRKSGAAATAVGRDRPPTDGCRSRWGCPLFVRFSIPVVCRAAAADEGILHRPHRTVDYRIGWSAVSSHCLACDLFNDVLGAAGIFSEFRRIELIDQSMPVGMTPQLMASSCNLPDQPRVAFRDPTKYKKSAV